MRFLLYLILITSLTFSCKEGNSEIKNNSGSNESKTTESITQASVSKDKKAVSEIKKITQQTDSDNVVISFDKITMEEIRKNSMSDGGNNLKKPLVFSENGVEVEISNAFYLKSQTSKQLPTASPPNSLSGSIVIIKINNGASFNFESAMIGSLESPKKVKIIGARGKDTAHEKKMELTHTNFKKYDFGFDNIESLIIWGGLNGAVIDDLEITLN